MSWAGQPTRRAACGTVGAVKANSPFTNLAPALARTRGGLPCSRRLRLRPVARMGAGLAGYFGGLELGAVPMRYNICDSLSPALQSRFSRFQCGPAAMSGRLLAAS